MAIDIRYELVLVFSILVRVMTHLLQDKIPGVEPAT